MLRKYFTAFRQRKTSWKNWSCIFWSIRWCHVHFHKLYHIQKQMFTGILQNSCSGNFEKNPGTYPWWNTMLVKLQTFPQYYWSRTPPWMFSCLFSKIFRTAVFIQHLWMVAYWFTHVNCRVNVGQECEDM